MRRVLFQVGGTQVWSYPVFLYIGLVCGFYVNYALAPRMGMPRASAAAATLILLAPAISGARLWFVFDHWAIYRRDPRRILRRAEGGMTIYGGLILALALSPPVLAGFRLSFANFWDASTFTMLVGMIFTRIGCLLNGCCAGRRSDGPLGLWLADHRGHWERRYPVALLEIGCAALLLAGSAALLLVHAPRGTIFVFGVLGYATVRIGLDRLRETSPRSRLSRSAAVRTFVAVSVVASAVGAAASGAYT